MGDKNGGHSDSSLDTQDQFAHFITQVGIETNVRIQPAAYDLVTLTTDNLLAFFTSSFLCRYCMQERLRLRGLLVLKKLGCLMGA